MNKLWAAITEALQTGEISGVTVGKTSIYLTLPSVKEESDKPKRGRKPRASKLAPEAVMLETNGNADDLEIPASLRRVDSGRSA